MPFPVVFNRAMSKYDSINLRWSLYFESWVIATIITGVYNQWTGIVDWTSGLD